MTSADDDKQEYEFDDLDLDADLDLEDDSALDSELSGYEGLQKDDLLTEEGDVATALPAGPDKALFSPGILVHKGKRFAVGLTWLTAEDGNDLPLIKSRARQLGADFYCVRNTIATQHGFAYLDKGHKMGMNAAAALAADALIGEWHGVFVGENGWWYVAVHADTIAPDGDLFFESEELAYNHYTDMAANYNWPRSYAPASWNIPKTNGEIELSKLFDDMPSTILKPSSMNAVFGGKRNKEIALVVGGLFLVVLFAAVIARETIPSIIPKPKIAPGVQVAAPEIIKAPPREPVKIVDSEKLKNTLDSGYLPQPSKVLDACLRGFASLTRAFPGWTLDTLRCRNGLAEAKWQRGTGSLDSLRPYLSSFPFGVTQSFSGDNTFLASSVIGAMTQFNQDVKFPEREVAILALNDRFGKSMFITVQDVIPPPKPQKAAPSIAQRSRKGIKSIVEGKPQEPEEPQVTMDELPYLSVEMRADTPPNLTLELFDIPGLVIDMVEWSVKGQTWKYNARVLLKYDRTAAASRSAQSTATKRP